MRDTLTSSRSASRARPFYKKPAAVAWLVIVALGLLLTLVLMSMG